MFVMHRHGFQQTSTEFGMTHPYTIQMVRMGFDVCAQGLHKATNHWCRHDGNVRQPIRGSLTLVI